jgi:hypothetical protein
MPIATRSVAHHENALPVRSALIETFSLYFLLSTRVVAPIFAALTFVAPETGPVLRSTALRLHAPALLAILIKIDDLHRVLPFRDGHIYQFGEI